MAHLISKWRRTASDQSLCRNKILITHLVESSYQMYAARTTPYQGSLMIDICDLELVGSKLEQDGLALDLAESYFKQQVITPEYAGDLLNKCAIANLVGDKIVGQALSMKLAREISVKRISGVPFLMIFKFQQK